MNYVESIGTTPDKAQAGRAETKLRTTTRRRRSNDPEVQAAAAKWVADATGRARDAAVAADDGSRRRRAPAGSCSDMQEILEVAESWQETTQYAPPTGSCCS